ncbi:MAG TPA: hypothetical protein VKR31_09395 [Rhizomicrobium sp.]|nr:hypothetical protein [Rhizomicrobium sp.]
MPNEAAFHEKHINAVENGVFVPPTVLALRLATALERKGEDIFCLAPSR